MICAGPYKMLKKLHKSLTARANQDSVLIANAMFTKEGFPMEEAFVATNKANFQCESRSLDFRHPSKAADEINEWVNNKTKGSSPYLFYLFNRICISSPISIVFGHQKVLSVGAMLLDLASSLWMRLIYQIKCCSAAYLSRSHPQPGQSGHAGLGADPPGRCQLHLLQRPVEVPLPAREHQDEVLHQRRRDRTQSSHDVPTFRLQHG